MDNMDFTMKFEGAQQEKMTVEEAMKIVYGALKEKGYNPVNQIIGYLLSGDSSYITSYKDARGIIRRFERDEILEAVITKYLEESR
ncbi:IreB family regulatory phosphoprotein [Peptacetobacter hiranonis]|uniref:IreB family regulatory phosphoprotein n=1 Tax=Peptacetobacter hiranonis TaxID=89152 RepID=UPI001917756F|nr:IreB family regulatory phosphoprotein [Peptacetobacter hiranonis]QQQ85887.1 IreB family regulatory phosphoprotein [Peptacetobacter hiranonis]